MNRNRQFASASIALVALIGVFVFGNIQRSHMKPTKGALLLERQLEGSLIIARFSVLAEEYPGFLNEVRSQPVTANWVKQTSRNGQPRWVFTVRQLPLPKDLKWSTITVADALYEASFHVETDGRRAHDKVHKDAQQFYAAQRKYQGAKKSSWPPRSVSRNEMRVTYESSQVWLLASQLETQFPALAQALRADHTIRDLGVPEGTSVSEWLTGPALTLPSDQVFPVLNRFRSVAFWQSSSIDSRTPEKPILQAFDKLEQELIG
jgi:hypothetical protein